MPQFPQLADAGGETQPPALKSFKVKREAVSGELLSISVQAVINSAAFPGGGIADSCGCLR